MESIGSPFFEYIDHVNQPETTANNQCVAKFFFICRDREWFSRRNAQLMKKGLDGKGA